MMGDHEETVFWHGLGQSAGDWKETIRLSSCPEADCPELFSLGEISQMSATGVLPALSFFSRGKRMHIHSDLTGT